MRYTFSVHHLTGQKIVFHQDIILLVKRLRIPLQPFLHTLLSCIDLQMQMALNLASDGETALTAKLWAGISLQNSVDPNAVSLASGAVYNGAPGARPIANKPMRRGSL